MLHLIIAKKNEMEKTTKRTYKFEGRKNRLKNHVVQDLTFT